MISCVLYINPTIKTFMQITRRELHKNGTIMNQKDNTEMVIIKVIVILTKLLLLCIHIHKGR